MTNSQQIETLRKESTATLLDTYLSNVERIANLALELDTLERLQKNTEAVITERMNYRSGPNALGCESLQWKGYVFVCAKGSLAVYTPITLDPQKVTTVEAGEPEIAF